MRALIAVGFLALSLGACDFDGNRGDPGSFELTSPALSTPIKGSASFRAQPGLEFAVFLDGSLGSLVFVSPTEGVPRRGTYTVERDRSTM